jgi:circadian clock protein KaiC
LATAKVRQLENTRRLPQLEKALTGITGFDEVTNGGVPKGRTTIVCGGPGCGKTMFAVEFLVRGATQHGEPGVLMTFEETGEDITENVASLGFDLKDLVARKKLVTDYVHVEPSEIQETGAYDLEGLFVRLQYAVESIGAKRVVLDTLDAIFSGFSNQGLLRAELRRMFRWLKARGLTTVVTAERGDGTLTRHGLEEYVSDCVVLLDHRVAEQLSTRRMRVVKYRGTSHGADEYPFLIDDQGFSVLPSTSMKLNHAVSKERVSSGIKDLDEMLESKGFYRGTTILVSGTAGSGKSSIAAHFAQQAAIDGRKCLYVAFEESPMQMIRNMRSIGVDLEKPAKKGILHLEAWRPTQGGLEMHLLKIHKLVERLEPEVVIVDPVTNLMSGNMREIHAMLMRLIDFLKTKQITTLFTSLAAGAHKDLEQSDVGISSLIDTWILVRDVELNGERNRCIYVLKSRGMAHSNQVREFTMSNDGIKLIPVYVGGGTVLTGSARFSQEARERADALLRKQGAEERRNALEQRRRTVEAQVAALRATLADEEARVGTQASEDEERERVLERNSIEMANLRAGKSGVGRQ